MTEPEPRHDAEPPPQSPPVATPDSIPPTEETPPLEADEVSLLPWFFAVGFVVLAAAIGFVWWQPRIVPTPQAAEVQAVRLQLQALQIRVDQLEARSPGGSVDLGPLKDRVAALEKRSPPNLGPLEARISALEQKTQDTTQVPARVDALAARVDAMSGRDRGADAQLTQRLDADEARLAALEHQVTQVAAQTGQVAAQTGQAARLARIGAARAALAAGQPLGDIPGAPPAVARFATAPPPTLAALRLAFPKAEHTALEAAKPDVAGKPFLSQVLSRAEELVTIRQGDRVLVGDSASAVLQRARVALDAGDLSGAVTAVSALTGPAAAAMAGWRADAVAVVEARAGLAAMATHP